MRLSRYYEENLFTSTFFIGNILSSKQQFINISNFYDVRPMTSLQNLSLRRDTSLSKEEKQDSRRFALAPQLDALPQNKVHQQNQKMLRNFKLQMQPQAVPVSDFSILTKPTSMKIVASSDLATDP